MRRLYVHIGAHRTGTTYLQNCFHMNASKFAQFGIDALSDLAIWGQGQHNVALAYLGWALRDEPRGPEQYRRMFRERIRRSPLPSVLVSSEFFELFDAAAIRRFRTDIEGLETVVIYSVRNQPDYLKSFYSESFKHANTDEFETWLEERMHAALGDFYAITQRWAGELPAGMVRIVIYDNLLRAQANIFEFFAREVLSLPASASLQLPRQSRINPSTDSGMHWLLREMNLRPGRAESHVEGIGAKYLRMRRRLESAYSALPSRSGEGKRSMRLDPLTVQAIEARFESSNAQLLREFGSCICNPTAGGRLFPERTREANSDGTLSQSVGQRELLDLMFAILTADE
jgi:hypothetical protein